MCIICGGNIIGVGLGLPLRCSTVQCYCKCVLMPGPSNPLHIWPGLDLQDSRNLISQTSALLSAQVFRVFISFWLCEGMGGMKGSMPFQPPLNQKQSLHRVKGVSSQQQRQHRRMCSYSDSTFFRHSINQTTKQNKQTTNLQLFS